MAKFTVMAVTSSDGFIARKQGESPQGWASAEEQALFFEAVDAADWSFMGRLTHEAALRPNRRRVIFSEGVRAPEFRSPNQLWVDPSYTSMQKILRILSEVHPAEKCLVLGGARVHQYYHDQKLIDLFVLTIEPVTFGGGIALFPGQEAVEPVGLLQSLGYCIERQQLLNTAGTRLIEFHPLFGR